MMLPLEVNLDTRHYSQYQNFEHTLKPLIPNFSSKFHSGCQVETSKEATYVGYLLETRPCSVDHRAALLKTFLLAEK